MATPAGARAGRATYRHPAMSRRQAGSVAQERLQTPLMGELKQVSGEDKRKALQQRTSTIETMIKCRLGNLSIQDHSKGKIEIESSVIEKETEIENVTEKGIAIEIDDATSLRAETGPTVEASVDQIQCRDEDIMSDRLIDQVDPDLATLTTKLSEGVGRDSAPMIETIVEIKAASVHRKVQVEVNQAKTRSHYAIRTVIITQVATIGVRAESQANQTPIPSLSSFRAKSSFVLTIKCAKYG